MFCRYCGSHISDDSLFCAKCGKRLGPRENPRLAKIAETLHLKTPYPYFVLLVLLFVAWTIFSRPTHADYSHLKWSFELDKKLDVPNSNTFEQALSLVVENTGPTPAQEIPIELSARIEPMKQADVEADFLGRKLLILQGGHTLPLVVVVAGQIPPGGKKRILLNGTITAEPPFKVTYEVHEEDRQPVLASYVFERE
jgi:zinc ribbon protein